LRRLFFSSITTVFVLSALWFGAAPAYAQQTPTTFFPSLSNGALPLCRVGINGTLHSYPIKPLRLGWYLDYGAGGSPVPSANISYFPMLRLEQTSSGYNFSFSHLREPATEAQLRAAVTARRGTYWFVGNEPDRKQYQDDMEPQAYARAYHDLYQIIKDEDPTAKIVAGAIVQPTPVRLEYLDLVLAQYKTLYNASMPVDVWAFHNFVLNEANCSHYASQHPDDPDLVASICWGADVPPGVDAIDGLRIDVQENDNFELFKQQVIAFRQWMADNGYRNTPAFLSEFGVLMPQGLFSPDFDTARVNDFMNKTFDFLLNTTDENTGFPGDGNRLIQRFAWYSVDDNFDHNGFLFDRTLPVPASRTTMGNNFFNYTNAINENVDFFPTDLALNGTTLRATIGNSGNLAVGSSATVRFFNGNPSAGGVQIGSDKEISIQGCGEQAVVTTQWTGATAGNHTVYVQVSTNSQYETNDANNQRSVAVTVN
jgi:hypothetical protein